MSRRSSRPVHQRLGLQLPQCRRASQPDAYGWQTILPRQAAASVACQAGPVPAKPPQPRRLPVELMDRCFNCLSYNNKVADCKLCNPTMVESLMLPRLNTPVVAPVDACCVVNEASPDIQDRLDAFIGEIQMRIPTTLLAL